MMSAMTIAPPEFSELCSALYGDVVDPDVVWSEVTKAMPDSADVRAQRNAKIRRNVERGSNALGITAGGLGLAGALKDKRLKHGGPVSRALRATGKKMPKVLGRIGNKKVQAGLAATAVGTQVANLGGDFLIAGTLGEKKAATRPSRHYAGQPLSKALGVPGVSGDIRMMAGNVRQLWNPQTTHGAALPKTRSVPPGGQGGPRAAAARQKATVGPKPPPLHAGNAGPQPPLQMQSRQGVKDYRKFKAGQAQQVKDKNTWTAVGRDLGDAWQTKTGKVAAGTVAVVGANKVHGRRAGYESVPDYYGKRDDDVVFKGEFSKFDDAKQQAFGWASIVRKDGSPVVDKQGDYITIEDLEEAGYSYVQKSRVGGDMHRRDGEAPAHVSDMIESMIFTPEKIEKMGLPEGFPLGWWVGYQIHDPEVWEEVRKRGRTGFSIHGKGLRKDHDLDELMGY